MTGKEIVDRWWLIPCQVGVRDWGLLHAAIDSALAAEREACAKVAYIEDPAHSTYIADKIRARGTP